MGVLLVSADYVPSLVSRLRYQFRRRRVLNAALADRPW